MHEKIKQRKGSDSFGQEIGQLCHSLRISLRAYQLGRAVVVKRLATTAIFSSRRSLTSCWLANQEKQRLAVTR